MAGVRGRTTAEPSDEAVDELVAAVLTASRVLVGISARSLAKVEDSVTLTQFRTLVVLEGHGSSRLNQLAERLDVTPSTALRMVDRLITAGLVDRRENAQDRREVVIDLTTAGRSLVRKVTRSRRAEIERIVLAMPPNRRRELVRALDAFATAADEPAVAEAASRIGW
ncbi:MarR family winged helix-turn-helix transcriptional regulator [Kribbella sp. NBC_00889]|uniref:MarR family winged helix-turn-helix transcriptional regulator n=1 Tax=Kribbella sp. NBC_00889 TaxID=2975974 RepID=UPI0038642D49|nr:MarR family winged helix-turn-helix transcriptional regulator [Kribbella sp. NBC_00889]